MFDENMNGNQQEWPAYQPQGQQQGQPQPNYQNQPPQQNYQSNSNQGYQQNNQGNQNYQSNNNGGGNNGYQKNYQSNNNGGGYQKNYNNNNGGGYNRNNNFRGGGGRQQDMSEGTLYKPYVGTGNRETPHDVIERMRAVAIELERFNFILRTGGLDGVDEAMETAVKNPEIFLPWRNFNNKESKLTFNTKQSMDIAKIFHPGFDTLKDSIKAFLAKNARMVLGNNLKSQAMFVICWSEDGAETGRERSPKTGNVGHVIAIANAMRIPVFNFGKPDAEQRLRNYLELNHEPTQQQQIQH